MAASEAAGLRLLADCCHWCPITIKYTDRQIPVSIFPITAAILSGIPTLVKILWPYTPPTNADQHYPIMADLYNFVMAVQEAG